jgi:hypothetical protein
MIVNHRGDERLAPGYHLIANTSYGPLDITGSFISEELAQQRATELIAKGVWNGPIMIMERRLVSEVQSDPQDKPQD